MTAQKIFAALQGVTGESRELGDAARAGFLEWAFTLPNGSNAAEEARLALRDFESTPITAGAAALFIAHLRAACHVLPCPKRRGGAGGRRRMLH